MTVAKAPGAYLMRRAGTVHRIRLIDPLQKTTLGYEFIQQSSYGLWRIVVNKNKYIIGLIGLALGFGVSFFLTQNYNRNNMTQAASAQASGMPGAGGAAGQQAMMGQVQQTIEKAKNNPKDFDAQLNAASVFYEVDRYAEAVEYLKKAYAIDRAKFSKS